MEKNVSLACKRCLDSVWTIAYSLNCVGAEIEAYSRDIQLGYDLEEVLPELRVVENTNRIVVKIVVGGVSYDVTNPKYIFDY